MADGIVAVRVKTPQGTWLPLYTGTPLHELAAGQSSQFWEWSPEVCQLNFKSNEIRVEIDTSMETGIFVGLVDYIKVHGTSEQQDAAIPFVVGANVTLTYQATSFLSGSDSFTYAASDCPGQPLRMSAPATVEVNIINSNDAPYFTTSWLAVVSLDVDTPTTANIMGGLDSDTPSFVPGYGMSFRIPKLPKAVALTTLAGLPVVEGGAMSPTQAFPLGQSWFYTLDLTMNSASCGKDELTYTISDDSGASSPEYIVRFNVICPRPCSLSDDVEWTEAVCDQSTLTRKLTANWRNFSLSPGFNASDDNSTGCDLPRAPDLPGDVTVDCDAIDLDSSWAVNLIVAGAILAAAKVGLLVYALVHRNAPIYQKAQVSALATASTALCIGVTLVVARVILYTGVLHIVHDSRWNHGRLCSCPPSGLCGHVAVPFVRLVVAHCNHAPVRHALPNHHMQARIPLTSSEPRRPPWHLPPIKPRLTRLTTQVRPTRAQVVPRVEGR